MYAKVCKDKPERAIILRSQGFLIHIIINFYYYKFIYTMQYYLV